MTAPTQANDTITTVRPARRADAGTVRLSQRDIDGLMLAGEHYGAPYDLLADALRVQPDRLPAIAGAVAPRRVRRTREGSARDRGGAG